MRGLSVDNIGKVYGVGVGPGDPELMTLKAVRLIRESTVIAAAGKEIEKSKAYQIARAAVPEIEEKTKLSLPMPMTSDPEMLRTAHEEAVRSMQTFSRSRESTSEDSHSTQTPWLLTSSQRRKSRSTRGFR